MAAAAAAAALARIESTDRGSVHRRDDGTLYVQWDSESPSEPQIERITAQAEPVVVLDAPCSSWRAAQVWTTGYIAQNLPTLVGVRRNKANSSRFINENFSVVTDLAKSAGYAAEEQETLHNVSTSDFFSRADVPQYWSKSILDPELDTVRRDVADFDTFSVDLGLQDSFLWMAKANIRAAMHYDTAANFNCQLVGAKRFIIGSPTLWRHAGLFPSFHLSGRQSQKDITQDSLAELNRHVKGDERFRSVVLQKGQALFIPPYYLHAVETLDLCVNVNFFSSSRIRALEKQLLNRRFFRPPQLQAVLRETPALYPGALALFALDFVVRIKEALRAECDPQAPPFGHAEARELVRDMVDSRLAPLFEDLGCQSWDAGRCPALDLATAAQALDDATLSDLLEVGREAAQLVRGDPDLACRVEPMVDISLSDWIEAVVANGVGFEKSCSFLRCLALPTE